MYVSMLWNNLLWTIKYQGVNNNIILLQMKFHVTFNQAYLCLSYNGCQIEITSWKARAYGIFTRVGEVSEIERVSAANE